MTRRKFQYRAFDFDFREFADRTIGFLSFLQGILLSLLITSFATSSGTHTSFQSDPMAIALIALIIMMCFWIHRLRYPDRQDNIWRCLMTFSALTPVNFINSLILIMRVPSVDDGSLERDFSGIPHPRIAVVAVIMISCFATISAFIGFWVCHHEQRPLGNCSLGRIKPSAPQIACDPSRARSFIVPLYCADSELEGKSYPPATRYDKWTSIPV